jgi:hypothetical protein
VEGLDKEGGGDMKRFKRFLYVLFLFTCGLIGMAIGGWVVKVVPLTVGLPVSFIALLGLAWWVSKE